jgi:RNA polymerase sigma-70 factor (ECF subfamily)
MADRQFHAALRDAQRGREAGFTTLFRTCQPALLRTVRAYSPELAEDACSETWLYVSTHLARFEGDESGFRAWLVSIAKNRLADAVRSRSRRRTFSVADFDDGTPALHQWHGVDPADAAVQAEGTDRALALIRALPPDQAEAVLLRVVAGLDTKDVAQLMNRSPGAVRVLCHRGLRTLSHAVRPADQAVG